MTQVTSYVEGQPSDEDRILQFSTSAYFDMKPAQIGFIQPLHVILVGHLEPILIPKVEVLTLMTRPIPIPRQMAL